ncbi:gluconolaconase [Massilia sp. PAMC28688]|uniref:gluconolaconase n=1 Tax=Massilia sp. PAMC28688 TaxID=2861283 RepID=UPI001C63620A|nr:gluconolaconase [Massilia sp. PAMC28688]QYF94188.1 gluconolaconase [Massilia sp. PAMC28688]
MKLQHKKVAAVVLALAVAGAAVWYLGARPQTSLVAKVTRLADRAPPTVMGWQAGITDLAGGFDDPYGVALDAAGVVYVADAGDQNRIRRIGPDAAVADVAGGIEGFADGTGAAARFHTPSGIAFDARGNLIVADTGNHAIRMVTPAGVVTTLAGTGSAGFADGPGGQAQFNGPIGVALDKAGNIYVADTYNDRIRRIGTDGMVSTVAGSGTPGQLDGPAAAAMFDTPVAIASSADGVLYVADIRNGAIRRIGRDGQVATVAHSVPDVDDPLLRRPLALALTADGYLYVGDMARGRILQISPAGQLGGLTGIGIDIDVGDARSARLARPAGIALDRRGALIVADAGARLVRKVAPGRPGPAAGGIAGPAPVVPAAPFPWPLAPQDRAHEVVGVVGEARGSYDGEALHHFHNGLDVQGAMGVPVLSVSREKVSSPLPVGGVNSVGEGIGFDNFTYYHLRVGRTASNAALDPARFAIVKDDKGKPEQVRVRRGTRFEVGDSLGTVNSMYHVHLVYHAAGRVANAQMLPLPGFRDSVIPTIDAVTLRDAGGATLKARAGKRLLVPRSAGPLSIVVEAYDQADGNAARRKLGLYRVGYQLLGADGTPLAGYEQPVVNIEFNRLPPDRESVQVAYARDSGITVYGSARTRFLYVVTNVVRDGAARAGSWSAAQLAPGDYVIRILAADYAGNEAVQRRDLPITVVEG